MDSSEEKELFLLGFILLDDKRKKKSRNVDLGLWDISPAWKTRSDFKSSWASTWW